MNTATKLKAVPSSKPRPRRRKKSVGVMGQVREALRPEARLSTFVGMILGGFVPLGSFVVCHTEIPEAEGWRLWALAALVAGGLLFSAKTVWLWTREAFGDGWKASGFVILVEGIMVLSSTPNLSWGALALLVAINGVATGERLGRA